MTPATKPWPAPEPRPIPYSASIFELDAELQRLMVEVGEYEADGLPVPEELETQLRAYFEATVAKVDRIVEYIKHLTILENAKKAEKRRLDARAQAETAQVERIRAMLLAFMKERGHKFIKGKLNNVSLVPNSTAVLEIPDERAVPDEFRTVTVTLPKEDWNELPEAFREHYLCVPGIDRDKIKQALEDGEQIEWIQKVGSAIDLPAPRLNRGCHLRFS